MNSELKQFLVKLGTTNPELRPHIRSLLDGCEKLPEGGMRDNCEKKKEEGADKESASSKVAKLMGRQEAVLKKYLGSTSNPVQYYDDLPASVQKALVAVKDQETLDSDVDRWLGDNNNPYLRAAKSQKASLEGALIKLGKANPELRPHIRSLLATTKTASAMTFAAGIRANATLLLASTKDDDAENNLRYFYHLLLDCSRYANIGIHNYAASRLIEQAADAIDRENEGMLSKDQFGNPYT